MTNTEKLKFVESLEAAAEIVLYDHEIRTEYLTDDERAWMITALKSAVASQRR